MSVIAVYSVHEKKVSKAQRHVHRPYHVDELDEIPFNDMICDKDTLLFFCLSCRLFNSLPASQFMCILCVYCRCTQLTGAGWLMYIQ